MNKIIKTPQLWQKQLDNEQYRVTREAGTEAPFSGQYCDHTEAGYYHCVCCGHPLFNSQSKYHSGCGWPTFTEPINNETIESVEDNSLGMKRIEVRCKKCGGHLGHVFDDGPTGKLKSGKRGTGQRFCLNSASLKFQKK